MLSVLNQFGAFDEPPNGMENGGEVEVEVPQNAEGEPRQPVQNVEGRRSRRDLESPAGHHPEGHGDHGRGRTVEGRQADANLNVPLRRRLQCLPQIEQEERCGDYNPF